MSIDDLLGGARRVLFVHAHPDDETLATGGLIAELAARGVRVSVLTATRGEQGEVVPGPLSGLAGTPGLTAHREDEVAAACRTLGVAEQAFLGEGAARAGAAARRYTDSGMRWLDATETVAGPGDSAGADALTAADPAEVAADIAAYGRALGADALVSYDEDGGYGHPDHVALHAPTRAAAAALGVPFWEVASDPETGQAVLATPHHLGLLREALGHYASQLTVTEDEVVHVGGQRQPIVTSFWLTPA